MASLKKASNNMSNSESPETLILDQPENVCTILLASSSAQTASWSAEARHGDRTIAQHSCSRFLHGHLLLEPLLCIQLGLETEHLHPENTLTK